VTRRDRGGPSSNVYMIKSDEPVELIVVNREGSIIDRGRFINRASEIIGIYTQPSSKHFRVTNPGIMLFFADPSETGSFSHTFQSYSDQDRNQIDQRRGVVSAMAVIFSVFLQTTSLKPEPALKPSQLQPFIEYTQSTPHIDKSQVIAFV